MESAISIESLSLMPLHLCQQYSRFAHNLAHFLLSARFKPRLWFSAVRQISALMSRPPRSFTHSSIAPRIEPKFIFTRKFWTSATRIPGINRIKINYQSIVVVVGQWKGRNRTFLVFLVPTNTYLFQFATEAVRCSPSPGNDCVCVKGKFNLMARLFNAKLSDARRQCLHRWPNVAATHFPPLVQSELFLFRVRFRAFFCWLFVWNINTLDGRRRDMYDAVRLQDTFDWFFIFASNHHSVLMCYPKYTFLTTYCSRTNI